MTIVLKSEDYKYPTKIERDTVDNEYPKIEKFEFSNGNIFDDKSFIESKRTHDLFWWNNCLINRFGKLCESFIFLKSNFNRGVEDNMSKCTSDNILNNVLFDYYSEIFYYYFFSTRDVIAQVINVFFRIYDKEDNLYLNKKFIDKITDNNTKNCLISFFKTTKNSSDFRNGFAHRYTPNLSDFRPNLFNDENGYEFIGFGSSEIVKPQEIVNDIKESLNSLAKLMSDLKILLVD